MTDYSPTKEPSMKSRLLAAAVCSAILFTSGAFGQTSAPATRPATQPAAARRAGVKPKVAVIELSGEFRERPADFSLSSLLGNGESKSPALSQLITTLNKASRDATVSGVFLELKDFSLTVSQAQDVGSLIK
jgi:hypothetical protein